jgi:hypothetical protein
MLARENAMPINRLTVVAGFGGSALRFGYGASK